MKQAHAWALAGMALGIGLASEARADPCSDFGSSAQVAGVRLLTASTVAGDERWTDRGGRPGAPVGAAFCRVRGVIETEIEFELWLPSQPWNGKLLAAGVGGEAGTFNYADMARGVRRGYAAASTDTGHREGDRDWAFRRPDRRANFADRANHLLALAAKALVAAYYGHGPDHAYFVGCSGGGREGLKEAQAHPEDFDGVLAGGAGPDQLAVSMRLLWSQYVIGPSSTKLIDADHWRLVARAGTQACDVLDGVRDGVVDDPLACHFDPGVLLCEPGQDAAECLSTEQLAAVRRIYAPLLDEDGKAIDQGVLPGVTITLEPRSAFAYSLFGKVVHDDPNWNPASLSIKRDMAAARAAWPELPNDQPDLSQFRQRGGKLLYYHGWMDPWILAQGPIAYHREVGRRLGGSDDFFRLFMVPGMGHCRGGAGTDHFGGAGADAPVVDPTHDMLSALEAWVERGIAPQRIVASRVEDGRVIRTRPLCPYPQRAVYRGSGSSDDASNFDCRDKDGAP